MYEKMPRQSCRRQHKLSKKNHNDRYSNFSQMILCAGNHFCAHQIEALSSKHKFFCGRGASSHTYRKQRARASITLEMSVILPFFVSFLVFFLFLFRVLWVQESVEEALLYASRSLAVASFDLSEKKSSAASLAKAQLLFWKGLEESDCPVSFVKGGKLGISLLDSECDGDEILLRAAYQMQVPCALTGRFCYRLTQCARSRKWIGDCSLEDHSAAGAGEWVFITPEGSAYHTTRNCHYLDLTIRAVNAAACSAQRNASGAVYKRCETCGAAGGVSVYITDYGTRYHSSLSCSGLKRTIYMVKKTQIGGRHACSKCGVN